MASRTDGSDAPDGSGEDAPWARRSFAIKRRSKSAAEPLNPALSSSSLSMVRHMREVPL